MSNLHLPDDLYSEYPDFPLGICSPPSGTPKTMGFGDDAEYICDWRPNGSSHYTEYSYPPPAQPPLDFAARQLAIMNAQYAARPPQPLGDRPINLPHGPIPSVQATDKLAGPTTESPSGKRPRKPRTVGEKPDEGKAPRSVFGGEDLLRLGRAVAVNARIREKGFQHDVGYHTVQNKAKALVAYKKNPECDDARSVASHLTGEICITMGAVLEQMEKQYDDAKNKSDEAKAKLKKKNEDDREAGEEIRAAAMRGCGRKREATRSPSPASDTDSSAPSNALSASSLLDLSDIENKEEGERKSKRRHTMDRRTSGASSAAAFTEITKILEKDAAHHEEHQKEVVNTMKVYAENAKQSQAVMANFLERLLDKA
ncbi:hypothetical protein DFH07DRAFT_964770 [Mycena maculata]|uniref:Uncharacterized protein n=1 Tax=Mycena maculata TaxID=230809 RepID=A0AAD7IFQ3_9AGAR|nr:hypothetical protein DFH07DRAFT_964770 [Mycena maculata]